MFKKILPLVALAFLAFMAVGCCPNQENECHRLTR